MNRMQRTVLAIAGATAILMLLFPPWQTSYTIAFEALDEPRTGAQDRELMDSVSRPSSPVVSYRFVLPWPTDSSFVESSGARISASYRVAWTVLIRNLVVLVVIAGAVFFIVASQRDKTNARATRKQIAVSYPFIAEIPENLLVERLMSDKYWRSTVLGLHDVPADPVVLQRVPLNGAPGSFKGDVDILLCSADDPGLATAIEVKRIKVGAGAFLVAQPNKLHEFEVGVRQANMLADIGFCQVYLYVLVVVDSREQNAGRRTYDGLTPDLRRIVSDTISTESLAPRVGLFECEFVQPMDHAPLGVGSYSGHLHRLAQSVAQAPALTNWVAQQLLGIGRTV